jgi:hypothetical protein
MVFVVKKKKNSYAHLEKHGEPTYFVVNESAKTIAAREMIINNMQKIALAGFRVGQSVKIVSKSHAATRQQHKDNMDEIIDSFMNLNPMQEQKEITKAKLLVKTLKRKEVSDRDVVLASCEKNLETMRKIIKRSNDKGLRHLASSPSIVNSLDVAPHLDSLVCHTLDAINMEPIRYTLREFMEKKAFTKHAIVLHGASGTGKTSFAQWLCKKMALVLQEDADAPYLLRVNTTDSLGKVRNDVQAGVPILLDEWTPTRLRNSAALSIDELKNVLSVEDTVQFHLRYEELVVPPAPRVITSNAESPSDWCYQIPPDYITWLERLSLSAGSTGCQAQRAAKTELEKMNNDAVAVCRRTIFVHIPVSLIPAHKKRSAISVVADEPSCAKMRKLLDSDEDM